MVDVVARNCCSFFAPLLCHLIAGGGQRVAAPSIAGATSGAGGSDDSVGAGVGVGLILGYPTTKRDVLAMNGSMFWWLSSSCVVVLVSIVVAAAVAAVAAVVAAVDDAVVGDKSRK